MMSEILFVIVNGFRICCLVGDECCMLTVMLGHG